MALEEKARPHRIRIFSVDLDSMPGPRPGGHFQPFPPSPTPLLHAGKATPDFLVCYEFELREAAGDRRTPPDSTPSQAGA